MGSFVFAPSLDIAPLAVDVRIDGVRRSDIYCSGVTLSHGTEGSQASLTVPGRNWDGAKREFLGRFVQVFAGYPGADRTQVFNGYVTPVGGTTPDGYVTIEARSALGLADSIFVGQQWTDENDLVVEYPRAVRRNGVLEETGWSVRSILRDIFSGARATWRGGGGSLPSGWRSRVQLGSLAPLYSVFNDVTLGDQTFSQATLKEALDRLLGLVGTVSLRERFDGVRTVLEFFELADPGAPTKTVRVARPNEAVVGSNVLTIGEEVSADGVKTRLIGMGDRRKFVVSVTTDHPTAPLEPDWNPALEAVVLANPEGTKRGNSADDPADETRSEFTPERARVFRRFRLPECLRRRIIEKQNALELTDGSAVPIQVWKWGRALQYDADTKAWTSQETATPVLLEGAQVDLENGVIVLRAPALNLVSSAVNESAIVVDQWQPAVVGVTLTVAGRRLLHDTGARPNGMSLDGIATDGLTEAVLNESFGWRQTTNEGFPFADDAGDEHVFDEAWAFIEGTGWASFLGATVLQDDELLLRDFVEMALRDKNAPRASFNIQTPFWTAGYVLGDRIVVVGQDDFRFGTHQVLSLAYDLTHDHSTTFSTDNGVPMTVSNILEGGE